MELAARRDAAFCDYGLRLASKQSPVRLEVAENTIRQELGMDNAERLPGASAIWKAFRGKALGRWYVDDTGYFVTFCSIVQVCSVLPSCGLMLLLIRDVV